MTTTAQRLAPERNRVLADDLQDFLAGVEADSSLFEPERLRDRLEVLDDLDIRFGGFDSKAFETITNERNHLRTMAIRSRLEAVNAELYQSIRSEIMLGAQPHRLLRWIQALASRNEKRTPAAGLAYDYRDELVSGILHLREPSQANLYPAPEMMFYQPTPVRHILHLIMASTLSDADAFVDLGSGLGHVALLASLLTGARSFGIEVEAAYVASAQECAQSLQLRRVQFIHEDARAADLSCGTVFYLYSPFTGSILADVLERLRKESTRRSIKICTLGPCTCTVAQESWLQASALPHPGQITVFQPYF